MADERLSRAWTRSAGSAGAELHGGCPADPPDPDDPLRQAPAGSGAVAVVRRVVSRGRTVFRHPVLLVAQSSGSPVPLTPTIRWVLLSIGVLAILGLGWTGFQGTIEIARRSDAVTIGQKLQTMAQFAFGLFGVLSVVCLFWARRWQRVMLVAWMIAVTLAGGLAPVVWGGATVGIGLLSGAASWLIAMLITWLMRAGPRGVQRDARPPG